jgi:hypothetical protein
MTPKGFDRERYRLTDPVRAMPQAAREIWRPMPDYGGLYEVSSLGRVRSLYFDPPRPCKLGVDSDRYSTVAVTKEGRRTTKTVHRLVCRAFHGEPSALHNEAAHLDGNRANPRADNLKWVSRPENMAHRVFHGTDDRGERHASAKLTNAEAEEIRALRGRASYADLAARYGVSRHTVEDVVRGRRYATHRRENSSLSRLVPTFTSRTHKAPVARGHRTYLEVSK